MFRWLALTLTLSVVAVLVGVLSAGLPVVEKVQNQVSRPKDFAGVKHEDRQPRGEQLALVNIAKEDVGDGELPETAAVRVVIPDCHLSAKDAQDVPARVDGDIWFLGTEVTGDENVPKEDLISEEIGFLAIMAKKTDPPKDVFTLDSDPQKTPYRRFHDGDPIEPNALIVLKDKRVFRRLKPGAVVKEQQLLGMINANDALDELNAAVSRLNGSEAKRIASAKTRDEALTRRTRMEELYRKGAAALEEYQGAILTYERYRYEEIENQFGVNTAKSDLNKAWTKLRHHEIRSSIAGVVKTIYKNNRGEAVKGFEKGADTVATLQNPSHLRIDGKVEVQYAHRLKPGMQVAVEPILRASYDKAFRGNPQEITGIAVSKNNLIVAANNDSRVFVWNPDSERRAQGILIHPAKVLSVACAPLNAKENVCLTGGEDGTGRIWNLDELTAEHPRATKPIQELRDGHRKPISAVAYSPNGRLCATGSDDYNVCVWDAANGSKLHTLSGHKGRVTSVQFVSDTQLVSASGDRSLILWDVQDGKQLKKYDDRGGDVSVLGVDPAGKQVLFDRGKEMHLLTLPDRHYVGSLQNASGAMAFTTMALFSPDGGMILTNGAADGRLQLWRTPDSHTRGYELTRLMWNSPATCGAFAPNGAFVVTGSKDGYVLVWPMPPKEIVEKQLTATIVSVDKALEDSSSVMIHAEMENPKNLLFTEDKATLVLYPEGK